MGKLIYSALASLDGYVADEHGNFEWAAPSNEVHAAVNDLTRPAGTMLLGRRMYEVLAVWESMGAADEPEVVRDFADIWRSADKVVYSRTLESASTARTRIHRSFDVDGVREMKALGDLTIGGPELAGQAFAAGLIDEFHLFLSPVIVGAGTPALPRGVRVGLELLSERGFDGGVVQLHYRVDGPT